MANKQELEKNLIERVAKKLGKDNQTLEEVIEKIMISVDNWANEHKKDLLGLDEETRQEFRKPSFLLSKLIKIKYVEGKLTNILYKNLKRAPGNLSEEQRMLAIYDTFKKFDYKCPYSGTLLLGGKEEIHLEHIIPVAMGGPTDDWNCIPICGTCNDSKGSKHLLDWWKDNRHVEEEYKLVKIFEHMTSKLLDETNKIKYVKQENNPMHLDAITFLNQLLNHIEENKQYIFNKTFESEKEKHNAINSKLKELKSTFEKVVKKNDRNTKTDKQYFTEQKAMVKYVKSLGVNSYYKVAYTYFNTIKEMQNLGKPEEEIKAFCIAQDDWFTPFYEKLIEYKKSHNGSFKGVTQDKEIGKIVSHIRASKKGRGKYRLTDERTEKLKVIGFTWEKEDWFTPFYEKLIIYKQANNGSFDLVGTDTEIGKTVNRVRLSKKGKSDTKLTTEMTKKLDAIGFPWIVEKEDRFPPFYEKLIEYRDKEIIGKNGKIKKPKGSFVGVTANEEIGQIVAQIRMAKKGIRGYKLTKEMIDKLDIIGFPWEKEDWFTLFYEKLIIYKELHNASFIGVTLDEEIGKKVSDIRQAYKGKGSTKLEPDMIRKLDAIGFPWVVEKKDWFTPFYEKLIIYKQANNGSFDLVGTDTEIGKTVNRVRLAKKEKGDTKLTAEMIEKLNAIGFIWVVEKEDWFTPFYKKLIEYRDKEIIENEKIIKPKGSFDLVTKDKKIGNIVGDVRQAKKRKGSRKLTPEMIEKLDEIGFPWVVEKEDWFTPFYDKLIKYKELHNRSFLGVTLDKEIGSKVNDIRQAYKGKGSTKLEPEMVKKLNAIGFPWEGRTKKVQRDDLSV